MRRKMNTNSDRYTLVQYFDEKFYVEGEVEASDLDKAIACVVGDGIHKEEIPEDACVMSQADLPKDAWIKRYGDDYEYEF
jgi:hypothetical protein